MQKPRILATGLSGLVGSRIVELLNHKYVFVNFDLTTGIDITNRAKVYQAIKQGKGEAFLHLAAFTDVDKAWEQQGNKKGVCYQVNVEGTNNVAQSCKKERIYLIHISTDFVFDGKNPPKGGYRETDIPHPIEWYGETKYLGELEVKKAGGKHSIVRIAFPFRSHFSAKLDLVRSIKTKLEQGNLYPMFADQIITPTFIDDLTAALDALIQKKPYGIYHVVGSTPITPFDLAKKIAKTFSLGLDQIKAGSLREYLKKAKRPYQMNLSISNEKAKKVLGVNLHTIDFSLKNLKQQMENPVEL
jgi:dTDP-4-dehydrorhamnose reductase